MITFVKLVCPACGANLDVDAKLSQCFCQYCGTKILLHNENEHTVNINQTSRFVDEAELAKQEVEKKKLEMAQEEKANEAAETFKRLALVPLIFVGMFSIPAIVAGMTIGISECMIMSVLNIISVGAILASYMSFYNLIKMKRPVAIFVYFIALIVASICLKYLLPYAD